MKNLTLINCFFVALTISHATEPTFELRVIPAHKDALECVLKNTTQDILSHSPDFWGNGNYLSSIFLSDPERDLRSLGPTVSYAVKPEKSILQPSMTYTETISARDLSILFSKVYYKVQWHLDERTSRPVFFGYVSQPKPLSPPIVADKNTSVETVLAYIYNKDMPENSELGFLVLNGTNVSVTVMQPLFNDSRLIVTAPSINYSNEVFTVSNTATNAVVEPRAVAEWRIPWQSTYQQLPAPDRAQLEATGNVDLYWKCGNYVSPVLPVFLKPTTP